MIVLLQSHVTYILDVAIILVNIILMFFNGMKNDVLGAGINIMIVMGLLFLIVIPCLVAAGASIIIAGILVALKIVVEIGDSKKKKQVEQA